MSNYSKTTNFTAKDALISGDPNKVILGADFDTEFDAIVTAVASKEDSANKGASNGYCGLTGGVVALTNIPTPLTGKSADMVDGYHAGNGSGAVPISNGTVNTNLNADLLDGQHGSYYLPASSYTAADVLTKIKTVDGSGSGLDADLLDGQSSAYYATAANLSKWYSGYCDSAATSEVVPAGWSISKGGTGSYTVTHNLGLSTNYSLRVALTIINVTGGRIDFVPISTNAFGVETWNSAGAAADAAFFIVAQEV